MVGGTRIELVTPAMSTQCSTAELTARLSRPPRFASAEGRSFSVVLRPLQALLKTRHNGGEKGPSHGLADAILHPGYDTRATTC